jgi:hypothetical protein
LTPYAPQRFWLHALLGGLVIVVGGCDQARRPRASAAPSGLSQPGPVLRKGDRVAWVGSSSTRIGVWPRTVEFLLRTRHPELGLDFRRFGVPGATFRAGTEVLERWPDDYRPDVVFFNYGVNDAGTGREGLARFMDDMERCVAAARVRGARVVLVTPQAADVRRSGPGAAARRTLYAETMLAHGRGKGWTVIDVHHPLDALQRAGHRENPGFSILRDSIHLTRPAYVAWGFFLFDRLDLPFVRSTATLTSEGQITATENCTISDVEAGPDTLSFTRADTVLPILPPGPLPPRYSVPLEAHSRYLLAVTGLQPGEYEIRCEGYPIGTAGAHALALGVNLNTLLLDRDREAPWSALAEAIWEGRMLELIGRTRWRFVVRKRQKGEK